MSHQNKKLTCNEFLILNNRYIGLQASDAEELSPRDPHLVYIGALPVVETTPWGKHQNPVISIFPQRLYQRSHADVDVSPQIKTLRRVNIIQKVPEVMTEEAKLFSFKQLWMGKINSLLLAIKYKS